MLFNSDFASYSTRIWAHNLMIRDLKFERNGMNMLNKYSVQQTAYFVFKKSLILFLRQSSRVFSNKDGTKSA